jgi:hypothetical protein
MKVSLNRQKVFLDQSPEDILFRGLDRGGRLIDFREDLFRKFSRTITRLNESRKPKRISSRKGLLDTRKLYRHQMDDQVFYKNKSYPASDTTFVFLIDASGSMVSFDNILKANAVVSAFAKANHLLMKDSLKMEVFTKGTPAFHMDSYVKGQVPTLCRVYSNTKGKKEYDNILRVSVDHPFEPIDRSTFRGYSGNYTPEYLTLPALLKWCKKNITTRNMVIINITDGSVQHAFSKSKYATNEDTKALRVKYLRGIPNLTLFVGNRADKLKDIYGTVVSVDSEGFANKFTSVLEKLISEYA